MPELIRALAFVKKAAAQTNHELGVLDATRADAIARACDDLIAGKLHEQFVVDVIQGGAGTSTNMNANEVIANRALERMGHARGRCARPSTHRLGSPCRRGNRVRGASARRRCRCSSGSPHSVRATMVWITVSSCGLIGKSRLTVEPGSLRRNQRL